ncbi:hypothetical protein L3Q82_002416 [Scortum barcoo]|uniref:Uncharacterized protein n=1 Tax=Scortum barcoo TaxID=214431 RepID=A0ACB8VY85_9TELE|nr:hypothetical protein L3Q82_002416 [Scortum barcoo]
MGEVRKLQKKLRQIENLEIKISLTPEERFKISRKAELRSRLAELQLQLSGPQQTLGIVGDGKKEKMKRQVEDAPEALPSQTPPASKILKGGEESKAQATPALAARQRETGGGTATGRQQGRTEPAKVSDLCRDSDKEPQLQQEEAEFTSLKSSWEKAKFRLRLLEGHNDIVTCVVAVDNLVVSGSRDTTVKVWHVPTATEHKNLGGHTGGVTCLSAPPPEYCKRLGQCVKSIYTFNAVTALCFVPEEDGYIVTGSGVFLRGEQLHVEKLQASDTVKRIIGLSHGGKVQAWSWHTFENCQSINAHQEAVTSIQVVSGSAGVQRLGRGRGVCVWENRCSDRDPLRLLHHWSGLVTGCGGGPGGRLTLSPRGDRVFLAYGRAWLKILHWRTGTMSRLTNHSSITGVTDCAHQTGGLLIGSCYDLVNGESSLNLFSLPLCRYLASLTWPDTPRILCFAAWTTGSGDHRWVTGGHNLIVWEQLPSSGKQRGDVTARRDSRLESCLLESEGDTEDDEDTDDYADNDGDNDDDANDNGERRERRPGAEEDGGSSSWLRCTLHSISPVARLPALRCLVPLLLVALVTEPSTCNRDDSEGEEQVDALSVQLSVTAQVTPTPLWAVVWGPTQPLEDETYHFLSSQETDPLHQHGGGQEAGTAASEGAPHPDASAQPREETPLESRDQEGEEAGGTEAEETEPEEVDPQFYVTVTISSLLILTAVVITAKLCYDRSCSQHPPPLSRGVAPPLSLALPRSLASEDSRQTLHSTSSSFTDRER